MVSNKFANLLKSLFNQNKRNSLKTIKSDNAVSSINSQISDKNINLHKKIKHHHHVEPLSNDAHSLNIYLGSDISGESYYWSPLSELNPHMLIVGVPGVGKTQTIKSIISSLNGYSNSVPTFAIDFENEYTDVIDSIIRPGLYISLSKSFWNRKSYSINPLDLLEGGPTTVKFKISSILAKIYKLGDQQESILRKAISDSYQSQQIFENDKSSWSRKSPRFELIKDNLETASKQKGENGSRARSTLNKLEPIFETDMFNGDTQITLNQLLKQGAVLSLLSLPTEETKLAASEFFLRWLWHEIQKQGELQNELQLLIVLDEAHKLAYELSPVTDLLRRGRKYGVSIILSTQQPGDFEYSELAFQNTSVHLSFRCDSDKHARQMSKELLSETDLYSALRKLGKFEAFVSSSNHDPVKIKISPYYQK